MTTNAISLLNKELAELRKFVDLLSSEQQSLLDNDTDSLLTLSETKTLAAGLLMDMSKSRRKSLLKNGIDTMEVWLAKHAPASQVLWHDIQKFAARAQQINSINGELIQTRMRHNQQALGVLHNASKSTAGLYGPDGQANFGNAGRHLGSG